MYSYILLFYRLMRKVRMMGSGNAQIILTSQGDGPVDLAKAHGPRQDLLDRPDQSG